ncbi:hypothetical protein [Sphingomonas quercus]|uniref:Uncharacterized protein n=1 Tax=Sphingomonas quercus TaxID=2842451 RepID=A0ABS6BHC2_9SPHN|nr:hypothetical protein [Sphingomonas quercus]MBU3077700.1 hypothetical protein [Sphingomonas quercus]
MKRLAAEGRAAQLTEALFRAPTRYSLRIASDGTSSSSLAIGDGPEEPVESVLVRARAALDPAGWSTVDHSYMQAETEAAVLGWLSALDCPVINRLDAETWYRPRTMLLHWMPLLRGSGLPTPETVVTDSTEAVAAFRRRLDTSDTPGAIFKSLRRNQAWLVGAGDWDGVAALQAHAPVCLAEPHGPVTVLCIVGERIVWGGQASVAERALSGRLMHFAHLAELAFVEIALGRLPEGPAVIHVDPLPWLEHFDATNQDEIIEALVDLLTGRASGMAREALP